MPDTSPRTRASVSRTRLSPVKGPTYSVGRLLHVVIVS